MTKRTIEKHNCHAHNQPDCAFCTSTNPKKIDLNKEFTGIGRDMLIAMIVTLRARLAEYENGLVIKGWWCVECDIFQGEECAPRTECRHCGKPKHAAD